jgi:mycofactocin system glycosyltransferase
MKSRAALTEDWPLPEGFIVSLNHRTRRRDGGRTLIGGAPTRVLYLSPAGAGLLREGTLRVTDRETAFLADRLLESGIADPVVGALPEIDPADLTYVIPVRDRPEPLNRLLASIGRRGRVIVVDDASRDAEATRAVAARHGAEIILLPHNLGVGGARNEGLSRVTTPYVAFVDSDVVLPPDAMPTMLRHFADPRVAVVAPRVVGLTGTAGGTWISRYEDALSSLDLGRHPATVRPRAVVSWVSGTTLVARANAIGAGFTSTTRAGEDVDFVWRLAKEGFRIRYEPSALVEHEHRSSVHEWISRKAFYGTGASWLAQRHPESIAPAILSPWGTALVLALAAQRRWSIPLAVVIFAATAARISRKLSRSERPVVTALELTTSGALAAITQATSLLLRHWWPVVAIVAPCSRRLRRAVVLAHFVDSATQHLRTRPQLDPVRFALARRLDDLAYGAGVWFSALRSRSLRALIPDLRARSKV